MLLNDAIALRTSSCRRGNRDTIRKARRIRTSRKTLRLNMVGATNCRQYHTEENDISDYNKVSKYPYICISTVKLE
jgi:gamma-glutamylcysteine synthetase